MNQLILRENNLGIRIGGIFMLLFALAVIATSLLIDFSKFFDDKNTFAGILTSIIGVVCGLAFGFGSLLMMTVRDKEMIFDAIQRKMLYRDWDFLRAIKANIPLVKLLISGKRKHLLKTTISTKTIFI